MSELRGVFLTYAYDEKRNLMPTLNWHKREEAVRAATRAPYRLLEAVAELSYGDADSENLLIQGDNLDALKALLPYYAGCVKCIAIDPPHNSYVTVWSWRHKLRRAMVRPGRDALSGRVEVDETYVVADPQAGLREGKHMPMSGFRRRTRL